MPYEIEWRRGSGKCKSPSVSVLFLSALCLVQWLGRFTPRHPPRGCFRCDYERLDSSVRRFSSHSRRARRVLGRRSCLGEGRNPSPSSSSSSFLRIPSSHNPVPRFQKCVRWCRFRYGIPYCRRTSALVPSPWTLIAETAPRQMQNACPRVRRSTCGLSHPCAHARTPCYILALHTSH